MSVQEQTSLAEKIVEDPELEAALESRQKLREQRKDLNRKIRDAEGAAQTKIDALELGIEAPVRVGRFVLTLKQTDAKDVSFTRGGGTRLQISLFDAGEE